MSTKDDAVFDSFDKARSNLRNAVITMLILSALFLTAIESSTDELEAYLNAVDTIDRNPEILKDYITWADKKISEYSKGKYENIFLEVEEATKFKLVDFPTAGKRNLPVTIARKEISTIEGLRYSTTPLLPRDISYWLNELPYRLKQNVEISIFEVNSIAAALEEGSFNCNSKKRFWTFCDVREKMDASNYPSGAQYFTLDTTPGACKESTEYSTGNLSVSCALSSIPNSSILTFLSEKNIHLPNQIFEPPSYQQLSGVLGEVKTVDDYRRKVHNQKIAAQKVQFSSVDFSSNYIVPGSIFVVVVIFLQMLSNLKFCIDNISEGNRYFSLSIMHRDIRIAIASRIIIVVIVLLYLISGFVYIDKNLLQVIMFFVAGIILGVVVFLISKLCFQLRDEVVR